MNILQEWRSVHKEAMSAIVETFKSVPVMDIENAKHDHLRCYMDYYNCINRLSEIYNANEFGRSILV